MGSFVLTRYSEHIFQAITMNTKLLLTSAIVAVSCIAFANAGQMFLLDDGDFEEHVRVNALHNKPNVGMAQYLFQFQLLMKKVILTAHQFHTKLQNHTKKVALDPSILLSRPILMPTSSGEFAMSLVTNTAVKFHIKHI